MGAIPHVPKINHKPTSQPICFELWPLHQSPSHPPDTSLRQLQAPRHPPQAPFFLGSPIWGPAPGREVVPGIASLSVSGRRGGLAFLGLTFELSPAVPGAGRAARLLPRSPPSSWWDGDKHRDARTGLPGAGHPLCWDPSVPLPAWPSEGKEQPAKPPKSWRRSQQQQQGRPTWIPWASKPWTATCRGCPTSSSRSST